MSQKSTWGSHVPINMTFLEVLPITGVIELGIGHNSTPSFVNKSPRTLSVENDQKWLKQIQQDYPPTDTHKYVHHEVSEIRSTRRSTISEQKLKAANTFYKQLCGDEYNMLFIDCYSGYRLEAFIAMHEQFDVITFHDYQAKPGRINHYDGKHVPYNTGLYDLWIDETYPAHTGIVISKKFAAQMDLIIDRHRNQVQQYTGKTYPSKLIKV